MNDRQFAEAQEAIYSEVGSTLLAMIDAAYVDDWKEVLFRGERITVSEAGSAGVRFGFRTTLVLHDGLTLPLIARPSLIASAERLDQLCRSRAPQLWSAFDYRLYRDSDGIAYECRFSYPPIEH